MTKCGYVYFGYLRSGVWSDLAAGRKIAGTGTIEKDGAVGDRWGLKVKISG